MINSKIQVASTVLIKDGEIIYHVGGKLLKKGRVGIYEIVNIYSGKRYIGQSCNLPKRISNHRTALERGVHKNSRMQKDFDSSEENPFEFRTILYCKEQELSFYELTLINTLQPEYNFKAVSVKEIIHADTD